MQKGEIQTIHTNDKKDDLNTFQTCFITCNNGLFPLLDTCKRHSVFWIYALYACIYVREDDVKTISFHVILIVLCLICAN